MDFDVGDVVVRVAEPHYDHHRAPPRNKPVRVAELYDWMGQDACRIEGYSSSHITGAWRAELFRKLPKADDTFTAEMRALRPHREKLPA